MKFKESIVGIEKAIFYFAILIGKKTKQLFSSINTSYKSGGRKYLVYGLMALVILYLLLGIAFAVRLYAYGKTDKIDRVASNFYLLPVAQVNRALIFNHEYQYKVYWATNYAQKAKVEVPAEMKQKIREDMVSSLIAMQQADKNRVVVKGEEISQAVDQAVSELEGKQKAKEFLRDYYGMKLGDLQTLMIPVIYQDKIKDSLFKQVQVRHILVKDENKAKDALKKIRDGAKFEDIAKDTSEDEGSKANGGLLADGQYLSRDSGLVAEFTDAMLKLKKGDVSEPVKSQFGYHIIKVEDIKGTIDKSYDEWIKDILAQMKVRYLIK